MSQEKINTSAIIQFLNTVKGADLSKQREVKLDIAAAKNLAHTLGLVMTRLAGNYEGLIDEISKAEPVVQVQMDGGTWDKEA